MSISAAIRNIEKKKTKAPSKEGIKRDGTRTYEVLLKVPRTPTFGISPEKKLVDRFLQCKNVLSVGLCKKLVSITF
jgi:hypothetical protein